MPRAGVVCSRRSPRDRSRLHRCRSAKSQMRRVRDGEVENVCHDESELLQRRRSMASVLAMVGVVVGVASLLFTGWQARLLSRQTALQNAMAGAATLQELFNWLHNVQGLLVKEPRLLPYFHPGVPE